MLDGLGWVFGIPGKIILWDRRVDNHDVSSRTEEAIASGDAIAYADKQAGTIVAGHVAGRKKAAADGLC